MKPDVSTQTLLPYLPHHRPRHHFAPQKHWINDPNGLIFLDGEYHLFYQHNPYGSDWGHMSWGHAISRDLIHWEELPVALEDDGETMVFSGCCILDENNTSSLGKDGRPPLVALYTGHHQSGLQTQQLAFSLDRGRTWTRHGVVLSENSSSFRDPKVFWHEKSQQWVMALVLASQCQVVLYGSRNLLEWEKLSTFGPAGHTGGEWEVPELLELPDDTGQHHWVLKVDLNPGGPYGGSGCQYFVGTFDGQGFTVTQQAKWLDQGKDFYAAITFANLEGRTVWLGWLNNWEYARKHIHSTYSGNMSVPREVALKRTPGGLVLVQRPVKEWDEMWSECFLHAEATVKPCEHQDLLELPRASFDLQAHFTAPALGVYALTLHTGEHLEWRLEFNLSTGQVVFTRAGDIHTEGFQGTREAALPSTDRQQVRLLVDHSTLEVFIQGGEVVFSEVFFPHQGTTRLSLEGGTAGVHVDIKATKPR